MIFRVFVTRKLDCPEWTDLRVVWAATRTPRGIVQRLSFQGSLSERPLPPSSSVHLQQPLDRQQRQEIGSDPAPKAGVGRTAEADFLALIVGHPDHMVILVELEPERIGW